MTRAGSEICRKACVDVAEKHDFSDLLAGAIYDTRCFFS